MIQALELAKRFAMRKKSNENYQAMQVMLAERMIRQLRDRGVELGELSVLEVGAGAGGYSKTLHSACREFVASDVNQNDFFKTSSIPFEHFNVLESPSRMERYDLAITASLIEHVEDPAKALKNIRQALKKGGRLFLTFPPFYSLSMLGGHRFKPFHFLGEKVAVYFHNRRHPDRPVADYRTCGGNYGLFPLRISTVDRLLKESGFRILHRYDRHLPINTTRLPGVFKDLFSIHVCYLAVKE